MLIAAQIEKFAKTNVLVIGDIMLDTYIKGTVDRMSPEAPVPVVSENNRYFCLGGAANVALNLKALGAKTHLISVIGKDAIGQKIQVLLEKESIEATLITDQSRKTTNKTRVFNGENQVLRIDDESLFAINDAIQEKIINELKSKKEIDLVIIQDYNKGLFTPDLIKQVINYCNQENIFIAVDPKKDNFNSFQNVNLFKPNLRELETGLNLTIDANDKDRVKQCVELIHELLNAQYTLVTMAEKGLFIKGSQNNLVPTSKINVKDVSGAGDTVISIASLCLVNQIDEITTGMLANLAAGIVCQEIGIVPITKNDILKALNE